MINNWYKLFPLFIFICIIVIISCSYPSDNYSYFSKIIDPTDNPTSKEKIALGKALFFDKRLSINETVSCATCHDPNLAFTD